MFGKATYMATAHLARFSGDGSGTGAAIGGAAAGIAGAIFGLPPSASGPIGAALGGLIGGLFHTQPPYYNEAADSSTRLINNAPGALAIHLRMMAWLARNDKSGLPAMQSVLDGYNQGNMAAHAGAPISFLTTLTAHEQNAVAAAGAAYAAGASDGQAQQAAQSVLDMADAMAAAAGAGAGVVSGAEDAWAAAGEQTYEILGQTFTQQQAIVGGAGLLLLAMIAGKRR